MISSDRKWISGYLGLGTEDWEQTANGDKTFSGEENVLYLDWGGDYMVYTFFKAH